MCESPARRRGPRQRAWARDRRPGAGEAGRADLVAQQQGPLQEGEREDDDGGDRQALDDAWHHAEQTVPPAQRPGPGEPSERAEEEPGDQRHREQGGHVQGGEGDDRGRAPVEPPLDQGLDQAAVVEGGDDQAGGDPDQVEGAEQEAAADAEHGQQPDDGEDQHVDGVDGHGFSFPRPGRLATLGAPAGSSGAIPLRWRSGSGAAGSGAAGLPVAMRRYRWSSLVTTAA